MLRPLLAAICTSLTTQMAFAQVDPILFEAVKRMFGTIYVKADRLTSAGALTGCSVDYSLLHPDWTYSQGRPLAIKGSFGFYQNSTAGAVFGLKVILADQYLERGQLISRPKLANTAYLETGTGISNVRALDSSHESDVEGGKLFVFRIDSPEQQEVLKAILDNNVRLVFNRSHGGADIRLPMDLTVTDVEIDGRRKHSHQAIDDFAGCFVKLLDDVQSRLRGSDRVR